MYEEPTSKPGNPNVKLLILLSCRHLGGDLFAIARCPGGGESMPKEHPGNRVI
jgi:hypothetical protein